MELVNIGNGTAVNIVVDDLKLRYEENEYARIRFGELLYLEPAKNNSNSERSAHVRIFSGNVVAIPPNDPAEWATWAIPEEFNPRPVEFLQGVEGDRLLPLELGTPRVQKRESRS